MKKCVKIIQCSSGRMWYRGLIGQCYEVLFEDEYDGMIVVDLANSRGDRGSIYPQDVEFYEINDDESAREFETILTDADIENLNTLEALASVYEELLILKEKMNGGA